jgi:Tfp pilus assembly protein PilO
MNISGNNKIHLKILGIAVAISMVLSIAGYMLILTPQNRNMKNLKNKLTEQKELYENAQTAAQEKTRTRLIEQIAGLRDKLNAFVINFDDAANLTFDISRIAQEKSVASVNVEPSNNASIETEEDKTRNIYERHIDVSCTTGFQQFAAFLNALERHQPVLFINQFSLIQSSQNRSAYNIKMDIAALVKKGQEDAKNTEVSLQTAGEKI